MMGINIIVAQNDSDSDSEAAYLFTSLQQRFLGMQRGKRCLLPSPMNSKYDAPGTVGPSRFLLGKAISIISRLLARPRNHLRASISIES